MRDKLPIKSHIWWLSIFSRGLGEGVLSSSSPIAMLQSASVSQRGELYTCLVPWFLYPVLTFCSFCPRDSPWLPGCDGQGGLCSWAPQDCGYHRDGSRQNTAHRADWSIPSPQSFCEVGLFTCPGAVAWEAGFKYGTHRVAYTKLFSRETGYGCHPGALPLPCSCLPVSLRKELIHLSGATAFLPPRDTSRFPGSGSQQGLHLESHRTTYISIVLKAAAWGSGFLSAWI